MHKLLYGLLVFVFIACNSKTDKGKTVTQSDTAVKKPVAHNWAREDELEFLDECVAGSKKRLGDEKALKVCMCVLKQLQEKNPENDSTKTISITSDTAQMAPILMSCEGQ